MENRIVVKRELFDKLIDRNPMVLRQGETHDDVWIRIKNYIECECGFDSVMDFILNRMYESPTEPYGCRVE